MFITTPQHHPGWTHPRTSLDKDDRVTVAINDVVDVGSITSEVGDRLLIAARISDTTSGYKLSSDMSSGNTFPTTTVDQLHMSAHAFQLGDSSNGITSVGLNQGDGSAMIAWIDRADMDNCKFAGADSGDPLVFGGIKSNAATAGTFTLTGTDAGIGSVSYGMKTRGGTQRNPVKIIRFPAGTNIPNGAFIDLMLEWMWYEWAVNDHPVVYPFLKEF